MDIKQLFKDDDAVSPVIGVILMVAITVILAAVIASFVLGMGQQNDPTPTATIGMDYEQTGSGGGVEYGILTLSHESGETIDAANLYIRGSGFSTSPSGTYITDGSWTQGGTFFGPNSEVKSGQSVDVGVESTYDVKVVWESPEGDTSSTLNEQTGPDA
ncbi:type IV pilin [Halosimplex amylolyticum]|uniref:type IV pilin n=1 Tax=Halosimplex amylolyticum TaxID=3396616 RepID=UPI003F576ACB